ncbi:MAG: Spy/CpxP family protein refolding chaperone [Polyangiaceae bacterium]|nr:Spy/CpxP family protein refolding chaperone [Polyangiaceae bacterium]
MKRQAQGRKKLRWLMAGVAAGTLFGAAACAVAVREEAPSDEVVAKEQAARGHRQPFGPVGVVIEVAKTHGNLRADQAETLAVVAQDLEADLEGRREAGAKLKASALAVVRAGRADPAALDQAVSEATQTFEQRARRGTDALVEVHAALEPAQRAAVAVELRRRIDAKYQASAEGRGRRGFERVAAHLALSALQVEQLKQIKQALIGERQRLHPTRDELVELTAAFETDDFATAVDAFREKKVRVLRARFTEASRRTDQVLGVFTPEQRALLADLIERGPERVLVGERAEKNP